MEGISMRKLGIALVFALFALGSSAISCTSGRPWMSLLPPEDRAAVAQILLAAQQATQAAETPPEEQVPPPPPPPLFVQADPLTPPELPSATGETYPEQATPIQLEEVVVIT